MDEKYILSFVGIALGWGLNQLSGMSTRSVERRQKLGLAIAALKAYHREVFLLRAHLHLWKARLPSREAYESVRQKITTRFETRHGHLAGSMHDILSAIAAFDPLCAEDLDCILTGFDEHRGIILTEFAANEKLYVQLLSKLEEGLDDIVKRTAEALLCLSRKHSIGTWLSVRRHLMQLRNRMIRESTLAVTNGMLDELRQIEDGQQTS